MCGIWGVSAKVDHKVDEQKMKILGLYNRTRGVDSCGYYWSGNIDKGVDEGYGVNRILEADFMDFIAQNDFVRGQLDGEIFIGHTRKSTIGTKSYDNAHPFEIDSLILAHNGTINNIRDLTKKYGINEVYSVDSQGLGLLIEQEGFGVLAEYVGYAALAMTFTHESEVLYLYQGASREFKSDKLLTWERPMFTLVQSEGIYFSSLYNSLMAISSDGTLPTRLIHNHVVKIVNGEFADEKENFYIYREENNVIIRQPKVDPKPVVSENNTEKKTTILLPESYVLTSTNLSDMIFTDDLNFEQFQKDKVYVQFARHYANGALLEGEYNIKEDGTIIRDNGQLFNEADRRLRDLETFYFVRGIMLVSRYDYKEALKITSDQAGWAASYLNIAQLLSEHSKYPLFCLETEALCLPLKERNKWYDNGRLVLKYRCFIPKFSNKAYQIENGITVDIKLLQK